MVLIPKEIENLPVASANMKSDKIKNWPAKERPRERLIAEGAERQSDADLLAIILRVGRGTFTEGVLGQNAPDFARELLKEFKGLRGLDRAHINSTEVSNLPVPLPLKDIQASSVRKLKDASKKAKALQEEAAKERLSAWNDFISAVFV